MPTVPAGFVHQAELERQIARAIKKLGKDVVRVNHGFGTDSTGEPSIFFRVVLTDSASREEHLAEVTYRISSTLVNELRPIENWGLLPYFNYRSVSEQRKRNDPDWA